MAGQTNIQEEGKTGREENASGHTQKQNTSITFGSGFWKEMGFPKLISFDYTDYILH